MRAKTAKTPEKRAFFCISAVLFSGILMLLLNTFGSNLIVAGLIFLFGEGWLDVEWIYMPAQIGLYLLALFLPGIFLLLMFRKGPFSAFSGPLATPRLPFLYLGMTIGLMYIVNLVIGLVFEDLLAPFETEMTADSFPQTTVGILLYFVMVCILPAIFEEWLFRGIMLKNLLPAIGRWPAILISSLVFGLMHLDPAQSVFAFGFGIFAGYAYCRTGSIWFAALIHFVNNAISSVAGYWMYVYQVEAMQMLLGLLTFCFMIAGVAAIPVYIFCVLRKRKIARKTTVERMLPSGGTVARLTALNPFLYLLIAGYVFVLWFFYFFIPTL